SPILIPLLIPLLVCVSIVLTIFLIFFCCGCLDCCTFCRVFDNHKDSKRCHLTWYFTKSGCCSFFFCASGRKRGICLCGHDEGERCGGCLSCRKKCACGWPGNCQSKELSCCGCCFCLCCVQEDVEEASIDVNNKKSGPPAFHLGTRHKVETETTRNFDPDEHRPLPPLSGEIEHKQKHRPQPKPPEYRKDQNLGGLSAHYDDDMQGLPNDMPTSSRLPSHLAPLRPALEEDLTLKEPNKKKKKRKKKTQLNEGEAEKEITNTESN
ncbi:hypothetical protein ACJMK2_027486, partial [Sinanodonta woodiana]